VLVGGGGLAADAVGVDLQQNGDSGAHDGRAIVQSSSIAPVM
jgi:hypothetical protein